MEKHDFRVINAVEAVVCFVLVDVQDEGVCWRRLAGRIGTLAHDESKRIAALMNRLHVGKL